MSETDTTTPMNFNVLSDNQLQELLEEAIEKGVAKAYEVFNRANYPEMLSPDSAAKLFDCTQQFLFKLERQGVIKKYRLGRRTYFKYSEIIAEMEDTSN